MYCKRLRCFGQHGPVAERPLCQGCYDGRVWPSLVLVVVLVAPAPATQPDLLTRARQSYNQGQYEAAIALATEARASGGPPAVVASASIVLARARLERFRNAGDEAELTSARDLLRTVDPTPLIPRDRQELLIGLAETLYLEGAFGAASEMFGSVADHLVDMDAVARDRVLDWWGTALDREAQSLDPAGRALAYAQLADRMDRELERNPGSVAAWSWLAGAMRGSGDLDRAWSAAVAAWVRAPLAGDRRATLRADLDRLVTDAIIPERLRKLGPQRNTPQAAEAMLAEWQDLKSRWQ